MLLLAYHRSVVRCQGLPGDRNCRLSARLPKAYRSPKFVVCQAARNKHQGNQPAQPSQHRARTPSTGPSGNGQTRASTSDFTPTSNDGSGDRPKDSTGGGGGDGDGSGNSDEAKALLVGAGKSLENLPEDLAEGLKTGQLGKDVMERYLNLQNSIFAPLLKIGGFRARLLADPSFIVKVGIEVGIGVFTKSTAEYSKRGKSFWSQIDFVAANVAMAIVADFMLVWLPAPTLSFRRAGGSRLPGSQLAISRFLASCPENAFQRVPKGYAPFTVGQRGGAILRNGAKLLAVGFGSSMIGVGATQALTFVRQALDPSFTTPNAPQNVLSVSAAYATFMGINSNLRYQFIAGIVEERGIEVAFKSNPRLCNLLSLVVRTTNTFLGSLMWIDYLRLLGMQPKE